MNDRNSGKRYLTGEVDAGSLRTYPAAFYRDHRITLLLGETAAGLDTDRRLVQLTSATGCRTGRWSS